MTQSSTEAANLLARCEQDGPAQPYGAEILRIDGAHEEVFVASDFHIAGGLNANENYDGTENFFADGSFLRFTRHLLRRSEKPKLLIINGDFVDFLRIVRVPSEENEYARWQTILRDIGIDRSIEELKTGISVRERDLGLKTDDYKSVWKLHVAETGHPEVFVALGEWVEAGNRVIIAKGNHDLEWYWPTVRNYLRLSLARAIVDGNDGSVEDILRTIVLPRLLFADDKILIDGDMYIEHGHRYDKYANVLGNPTLDGGTELNIPFGSFFNRYLINNVELVLPFVDNVRPSDNVLAAVMKQDFMLGLKLLFHHLPFMLKIIPKRYYRYMFGKFLAFVAAVGIPLLILIIMLIPELQKIDFGDDLSFIVKQLLNAAQQLGWALLSFVFARIVAYFQLAEPSSLNANARDVLQKHPEYRIMTMGHTHNPDQFETGNQWYYNTGTWIPIIETNSATIRHDRTYTFLHFRRNAQGVLDPTHLERWSDEANAARRLIVVEEK